MLQLESAVPTLKRFVCTFISILVRMGQQTEFPVRFLDVSIRTSSLQGEDIVKCRGIAFPYSYYCRLLFDGVLALLITLVVIAGPRSRAIGFRICSRGRSGHAAGRGRGSHEKISGSV